MGSRRLGRKRLHSIEKLGKSLTATEIGIGAGMEPALVRATQKRDGLQVVTEIVLDLGTSKGVIATAGDKAAIGVAGQAAEVFTWSQAVFGRLTASEIVCFEDPAGASGALGLFRKAASTNAAAALEDQVGVTAVHTGTTFAAGTSETDAITSDIYSATTFFTLACQAADTNTYTGGKLVLRLTGQADPLDDDI